MKANEIRIGNYIEIGNKITQVGEIFDDGITTELDKHQYEYLISDINSIPLTEDWLIQLGFDWDIYYQGYTEGNWVINPNLKNGFKINYGKRRNDPIIWDIRFVHQLQNLYFALTEKELEIR